MPGEHGLRPRRTSPGHEQPEGGTAISTQRYPRQVRLERVKGGYRYDLGDVVRGSTRYFRIRRHLDPGSELDGWWKVSVRNEVDNVDDLAVGMFENLTDVRVFLGAVPSPWHHWGG